MEPAATDSAAPLSQTFFLREAGEMLECETQLVPRLRALERLAHRSPLLRVLEVQTLLAKRQGERLERVFEVFRLPALRVISTAVSDLLRWNVRMGANQHAAALDGELLSVLERLDHYKVVTYSCLRDWASMLGNQHAAALLAHNHEDTRAANATLLHIAKREHISPMPGVSQMECLLVPPLRSLSSRERELLREIGTRSA